MAPNIITIRTLLLKKDMWGMSPVLTFDAGVGPTDLLPDT